MERKWEGNTLFIVWLLALVWGVCPVSAQVINIDASNNAKLLVRQLEMEASLKSIEESSESESKASKVETEKSDTILQMTLDRFYDCAPGLTQRMKEWAAIRASIEVAGKVLFNNGNDSMYKKLTKKITNRMFNLPEASSMPGDVVWRRYKDAFIRAEKSFLGTSSLEGLEDLVNTAMGVTEGEATSVLGAVNQLGGKKDGKGLFPEKYLSNENLTQIYSDEVNRIIEDVKQMRNSWVPSADKEAFYQKKIQELNKLYAQVRGANWVDFILESETTDRMNINEEYQKLLDKVGGSGKEPNKSGQK